MEDTRIPCSWRLHGCDDERSGWIDLSTELVRDQALLKVCEAPGVKEDVIASGRELERRHSQSENQMDPELRPERIQPSSMFSRVSNTGFEAMEGSPIENGLIPGRMTASLLKVCHR